MRHVFSAPEWRRMPPAAHSFLSCRKRMGRKEALENGIALTRLKSLSFCFAFSRYTVRRPNALRAAAQPDFPIARHAVRVVSFAPVEYLTYGKRKAVLFARAALRITKNGLPFKSQLKQTQSISITLPVYQRRIFSAFCKSKMHFRTNQTPGKIQGRGPQPPSWSF